jgi:hypothetical protein
VATLPRLASRTSTKTAQRTAGVVALGAVAGPVLFTLGWFVLGFISPGYTMWGTRIAPYSVVSQPLSGLGLGPTGPLMNATFVLSGLLIVAGAVGVFRSIPQLGPPARWTSTVLLALPGLGAVIDGIFTLEHFFFHFVGFGLALTTVAGFPIIGFLLRGVPSWRGFGTWLIVAGPVTLTLTVLYFATFTPTIEGIQHGVAGLTERLLILELQGWYVALGWLAFNKSKGESS